MALPTKWPSDIALDRAFMMPTRQTTCSIRVRARIDKRRQLLARARMGGVGRDRGTLTFDDPLSRITGPVRPAATAAYTETRPTTWRARRRRDLRTNDNERGTRQPGSIHFADTSVFKQRSGSRGGNGMHLKVRPQMRAGYQT